MAGKITQDAFGYNFAGPHFDDADHQVAAGRLGGVDGGGQGVQYPGVARLVASPRVAALRDLGLLKGIYKKTLGQPILPLPTAEHLLRILIAEGLRGGEILRDTSWRLFFRTENDVAHLLSQLAQERRIRFERVGGTVVLQVPEEWSQGE